MITEKADASVVVDAFVVMPNHVHLLILMLDDHENPHLSRIIQQWKGSISKKAGFPLWQHRFHDRLMRRADEYRKAKNYIRSNPERWKGDCFFISEQERPLAELG
ncbi:MAG: transposase [Oscillospiraceae bacterium]|nr:transposase [Oscillospiraceae bacterium]